MLRRFIAATGLALTGALAGCALGISDTQSPHLDFTANVEYARAIRSAQAQANECLRGKDAYSVSATRDDASHSGLVRIIAPFTDNDIARVEIKGSGSARSDVRIVMWGKGIWDQNAINAMRDAIVYDATSCTSFMPGVKKTQ